jgi:hypothetical protein
MSDPKDYWRVQVLARDDVIWLTRDEFINLRSCVEHGQNESALAILESLDERIEGKT